MNCQYLKGLISVKLSRKSEYAILALIDLAKNGLVNPVKMIDISTRNQIPKKFLEQILIQLKTIGIVKSSRGSNGGYFLAKPASDINLAQIIRLFDGPIGSVQSVSKYFYESTPIEQCPKLISIFKEIRDYVSDRMENTTIQDLL